MGLGNRSLFNSSARLHKHQPRTEPVFEERLAEVDGILGAPRQSLAPTYARARLLVVLCLRLSLVPAL